MNIEKLEKLKAFILAEPRRYNQGFWIFDETSAVVRDQQPPCGTAACLAGSACLMEGLKPSSTKTMGLLPGPEYVLVDGKKVFIRKAAKKILGIEELDEDEDEDDDGVPNADGLFDAGCVGWAPANREAYLSGATPRARAQAAAAELDRLIAIAKEEQKA